MLGPVLSTFLMLSLFTVDNGSSKIGMVCGPTSWRRKLQGRESLNDFPSITGLVAGGVRVGNQVVWLQSLYY